jgi:hypothetical protein
VLQQREVATGGDSERSTEQHDRASGNGSSASELGGSCEAVDCGDDQCGAAPW